MRDIFIWKMIIVNLRKIFDRMNINEKKPPFFSDPSQLKTIILLKNLTNLYICIIAHIEMEIPIAIT